MSCKINNSIPLKCKDSLGGVKTIYLFNYVKYSRSQIIVDNNVLISYPTTQIYEFQSLEKPNAEEKQNQNEGGKFQEQSITLTFGGSDFYELQKLIAKDYGLIFLDRNGYYRIFGLYNGVIADGLNYTTGSTKSETNGCTITFNGTEEVGGIFINDLEDAGFVPIIPIYYRITQSGEFRITQDGYYRIIN